MNNYLLAGSYAYDTILLHQGEFHAKILPESLARLNVAFSLDSVEEEFGGTAGNIAYNATLLEQNPLLIGCLGKDGQNYLERIKKLGLNPDTLTVFEKEKTPHAWLMTDTLNNQIIGFNAGAMKYKPKLPEVKNTPNLWHLSADNPFTTAWLARTALENNKSYFFDPGQALPYFATEGTKDMLSFEELVKNATGIFVNDYEGELLQERTKLSLEQMLSHSSQFIVRTLGSKGVELITKSGKQHFGVAKTNKIIDPTGCGDSFRAGFLYGYTNEHSLEECVKLGATMGSFAIEANGGQNHNPNKNDIFQRMKESFSYNYSCKP